MQKTSHLIKVWVINLESAKQRWDTLAPELEKLPWIFERFPAIRGSSLRPEDRKHFLDERLYSLKHGKQPVMGELGCYLSHMGVLKALLASDYEYAIVLEDDVRFRSIFEKTVNQLVANPKDWDLVKLSGVHSGTPIRIKGLSDGVSLAVPLSQLTGSSAYLINRDAARKLVDNISLMSLPYDHAFDRNWKYGFKLRMTVPLLCIHGIGDDTTINYSARSKNPLSFYKRIPTICFRIYNEFSRLIHRSIEVLCIKVRSSLTST